MIPLEQQINEVLPVSNDEAFFITGTNLNQPSNPQKNDKQGNILKHKLLQVISKKPLPDADVNIRFPVALFSPLKKYIKIHPKKKSKTESLSDICKIDPSFLKEINEFTTSECTKIKEELYSNEFYISPLYVSRREQENAEAMRTELKFQCESYNAIRSQIRTLETHIGNLKHRILPLKSEINYEEMWENTENELKETKMSNDMSELELEIYENIISRNKYSLNNMSKYISTMSFELKNVNAAIVDNASLYSKKKLQNVEDSKIVKSQVAEIPALDKQFLSSIKEPLTNDYSNALRYNIVVDHIEGSKRFERQLKAREKNERDQLMEKNCYNRTTVIRNCRFEKAK